MKRGEIWWADLPTPSGSEPGFRRPAVVVSADAYNLSRLGTVVLVVLTTNLSRENAPGNIRINRRESGLPRPSVANVTQLMTVDKRRLTEKVKRLSSTTMSRIDQGLRQSLSLTI
ncbi:type II toxin-antitoxin system PemK/MazF family toxin [bacterium]|nr:type II toxin-antitoxin system PemK/MazF family toxin [bacterium]